MKISQAEARRYRAQANRLESQLHQMFRSWGDEHPNGVCIGSVVVDDATLARVSTARTLKHAVVLTTGNGRIYFHALPQPKEQTK